MMIIFVMIALISCVESENDENITEPVIEEITTPYFTVDKEIYQLGDKININLFNSENCTRVALTDFGREPSSKYILNYRAIEDNKTIEMPTKKLTKGGDYTLWLCGSDSYDYLYTVDVHIDDADTNDYGISNATFNTSKEGNLLKSKLTIKTEHLNELTYRIYWCKDNVRLDDYMPIRSLTSINNGEIVVEFPQNMYKPKEANSMEIFVSEGVSTSYYLNVDDTLILPESKYVFTFNAISDLHVQSLRDSMLFNAHLKTTLKDIYASNSKAILGVGDITNFGKASEYEFVQSIFDSVNNTNNIPFYASIGNHEYMYFDDFNEPVGYFKNHFKLDSHYYSFNVNNYKFIALGTDKTSLYGIMSNEQLVWLENELKNISKDEVVFIMIHQGLKDTVDGTLKTKYNQDDYGFIENNNRLRNILKNHPNAIVFSGHSHQTLDGYVPVAYGNGKDASFANCGSNSYLNSYDDSEIGGAEGLYIEVYEDYILIRGREFSYGKWIANCQIVLPLNK